MVGHEVKGTRATTFTQRWSPLDEVVFVSYPEGYYLETQQDIIDMFDVVLGFWRTSCEGQRAYYVVDYTNYSSNLAHNDFYVKQLKRVVDECAVTIVRFGGDPLTRTGSRLRGMKLHLPTNLYATRKAALAVVRALREGKLTIAPDE